MEILDKLVWLNGATFLLTIIVAVLLGLFGGLLASRTDPKEYDDD